MIRPFVVACLLPMLPMPGFAQDDVADAKTIERIRAEIELVPSLHARFQGEPNLKGMPKFSAKKLAEYGAVDASADKERKRWAVDKKKFAEDHPLRGAVFDTMEAMEDVYKLNLRVTLLGGQITPKAKAAFLEEQAPIGMAIFQLEKKLKQMIEVDVARGQEKSKRWQLNFDFARTRLEANLIFLYEYNYTLGTIRRDALPELRPGDAGWRLTFHPNVQFVERKSKVYQADRTKRLQQFRTEHADTPWAFFADIEGGRLLGMEWAPAKE